MKIIQIFIVFSLLLIFAQSTSFNLSQPVPETCGGIWNTFGTVEDLPTLAAESTYGSGVGQKYTINYDGRFFYVLNLTGNPYEIGYLQGQLMKTELTDMVPKMYGWLENFLKTNVSVVAKLPSFVKNFVGTMGLHLFKVALDLTYEITKPYTPDRFNYEIQGMADSSGLSVWDLRGINMIPELLKASCSILGAYGPATTTGKLIQLRALDWESHAPLGEYPQITVYHSNEPGSVKAFANIGWPGFIGSITGYSPYIGVSERLRGNNAQDTTTRFGKPWNYALRDVLQFTSNIDQALDNLNDTKRTCTVYLGIGSSVNNTYRIIQYSQGEFEVFDDHHWFFDINNPQMDGVLYKAYHYDACFRDILHKYYGQIQPEVIRQITAGAQTGDSQVIVMDFANNQILAGYPQNGLPGYNRPFIHIDLNPFLQVKTQ